MSPARRARQRRPPGQARSGARRVRPAPARGRARTRHVAVDVGRAALPGASAHAQRLAHGRLRQVVVQAREVIAERADALLARAGGRVGPCAPPGRAGGCSGAPGARLPHVVHVEVAAGRLRSTARVTAPVLPPVPTGQRSGTDEARQPHARRGRPAGPAVAARARCARPHTRAGELTHAEPAGAAVGRARLDRPDHGLLAHQQGQVAQRAEVERVARPDEDVADGEELCARRTASAAAAAVQALLAAWGAAAGAPC